MNNITKYAHYNKWANETLLNIIEREIDETKLDTPIVSSFPTLRKTIYHIWDAENIWLKRLKGESLMEWPSKNFTGNFVEAKEMFLQHNDAFSNYIGKLSEEKLNENFTYKNVEGKTFTNPIWESVHHCLNHSTYHRGQMVTMLRQLGLNAISSTDFITYCRIMS